MLNGLQILVYMPLFKLKSPGNVNSFVEFFSELTKFQIVDTAAMAEQYYYFPEMDAVGLNFQNAGYLSTLILKNIGGILVIFAG